MKEIISLIRMKQYIKNLFIFAPIFFAGEIFNIDKTINVFFATILFSLLASSIYIINDIMDKEDDALHDKKKKRPIASGKISVNKALKISFLLFIVAMIGFILMDLYLYPLMYFILNILYSFAGKHKAPYDVFFIAIGFVLRLYLGASAADVYLSQWMVVNVFFLTLFLAIGKRYSEVVKKDDGCSSVVRKSIDGYNKEYIYILLAISSAGVIFSYLTYIIVVNQNLLTTAIFVVLGLFRYLQIIIIENKSENPTEISYKNISMVVIFLLWILTFYWMSNA